MWLNFKLIWPQLLEFSTLGSESLCCTRKIYPTYHTVHLRSVSHEPSVIPRCFLLSEVHFSSCAKPHSKLFTQEVKIHMKPLTFPQAYLPSKMHPYHILVFVLLEQMLSLTLPRVLKNHYTRSSGCAPQKWGLCPHASLRMPVTPSHHCTHAFINLHTLLF